MPICRTGTVTGTGAQRQSSLTEKAQPISAQEHAARIAKLQSLMQKRKIGAFLVEAGASLEYFTGVRWWRSERTTAALIPAEGEPLVLSRTQIQFRLRARRRFELVLLSST